MSGPTVSQAFLDYSVSRLAEAHQRIAACCDRLSEQQLQHRGADHENSIVNLLVHLEGNLRQFLLHGIGGAPDVRRRDAEFALQHLPAAAAARASLDATLAEVSRLFASLDEQSLLQPVEPPLANSARHATVLALIYRIVSHFDHHTGQIIVLTKQLAGADLDLTIPRPR